MILNGTVVTKKIQDLIIEFKSFMEERHQDMLKFVVYLKTRLYL